jgi:hypothetical protein
MRVPVWASSQVEGHVVVVRASQNPQIPGFEPRPPYSFSPAALINAGSLA